MLITVAVSVGAILIGLSKGGIRGMGSVATILVALTVPADVAIGLVLPLMIAGDITALLALRHHIALRIVWPLVAGGIVGVAAASTVLANLTAQSLEMAIAAIIVAFVGYRFAVRGRGGWPPRLATTSAGVLTGVTAGITSTIAHVGGPPVSIHLLARQVAPLTFAGTSVAVFTFVNWLKVPGYLMAGLFDTELMWRMAPAIVLVVPGVFVGRWITARLNLAQFEVLILVGLVVGAALLVLV